MFPGPVRPRGEEDAGQHVGETRQGLRPVAGPRSGRFRLERGDVVDDGLDERPERLVDVLEAGPEQHPATAGVDLGGDLGDEPALAHPGLAGHDGDDGVASAGERPMAAELFTFVVPADERRGVGEQADRRGQHTFVGGWKPRVDAGGPAGVDPSRRACAGVRTRATPPCARRCTAGLRSRRS